MSYSIVFVQRLSPVKKGRISTGDRLLGATVSIDQAEAGTTFACSTESLTGNMAMCKADLVADPAGVVPG